MPGHPILPAMLPVPPRLLSLSPSSPSTFPPLPALSPSLPPLQGYMPSSLYNLNSKYGTEEELIACVKELQSHGFKVLGDAVLNHRCAQRQDAHGVWNLYEEPTWDQRAIVGEWGATGESRGRAGRVARWLRVGAGQFRERCDTAATAI